MAGRARRRWTWMAGLLGAGLILGACEREVVYPEVSGNTYSHFPILDIRYPRQLSVTVAYAYERDSDHGIALAGGSAGTAYLYRDRALEQPARFVFVHPIDQDEAGGIPPGNVERLGKRDYIARPVCVDREGEIDPFAAPYIAVLEETGHPLSRELYVLVFFARQVEADGRRVDVVFVEDVQRSGLTCAALGPDLEDPDEERVVLVEPLRVRAFSSFEIIN